MSIIRILPENVSNRIAAGEVIERPASVVKELMENAIDAAATIIVVNIEKAGKKLISVTDNGKGMDADDTILCFEPHATSKITCLEDMDKINTMGFRGEALPSIASISRFRLKTRKAEAMEGNEVIIEGGRFISSSPAGCAPGSEMTVKDLFFNTPARRKFLRADTTEEKHIIDMFCQIALAHYQLSFELIIDGQKVISSPADNDLRPRITTFFGKTMNGNLLPVQFEKAGIQLTGYIAKHGFTKKSRKEQRTYINNRPVESAAIFRGVKNAYASLVMKGCFPPVILFIYMSPDRVDFNVHPAKREVRFREAGLIANIITDAIKKTLQEAVKPTVNLPSALPFDTILAGASINYTPSDKEQQVFPDMQVPHFPSQKNSVPLPVIAPEIDMTTPPIEETAIPSQATTTLSHSQNETPQIQQITDTPPPIASTTETRFGILAFLDETYILASAESGLVIIDQHAAHERILFEQLMNTASNVETISQKLLLPVTLELSRSEIRFLKNNAEPFMELGFEVEPFGQNTIIIHAVPAAFSIDKVAVLFCDLLSDIIDGDGMSGRIDKAEIAKAACSKAVKAHDQLSITEAESLLQQLNNCQLPYSCPHGRPTIISISYKELEKRFGRK